MLDINNRKEVPVTLQWGWAVYGYSNGYDLMVNDRPKLINLYKSFHQATEGLKIKQLNSNRQGASFELRKIPIIVDELGKPYLLLNNGYTRTDFTRVVINN